MQDQFKIIILAMFLWPSTTIAQIDSIKQATVYVLPFDLYTRIGLDRTSIKTYPQVSKRVVTKNKAQKINRLTKASTQFEETSCKLDVRILCEIETYDQKMRIISIGTTRHMNASDKCYLPNKKLIRLLKSR